MTSFLCSDTEIESDASGSRCKNIKNKPLMEKKRRARINRSLSTLKQILIQDEHKNSTAHSKWEKADILEMTVEYLQQLRSQNCISSPSTSSISTPNNSTSPSLEKPNTTNFPATQIIPFMNPAMQPYVAYQQLAHLSMYSQLMSNQMRSLMGNKSSQEPIESPKSRNK
uniref:BHLH domain-containing protein n=1 Tax=Caenorhabditis tropicalis TaxID=1561998 RepID=A0A1I7TFU9_9PELO